MAIVAALAPPRFRSRANPAATIRFQIRFRRPRISILLSPARRAGQTGGGPHAREVAIRTRGTAECRRRLGAGSLLDHVAERAELVQLHLVELHFLGLAPGHRRLVEIGVDRLVGFRAAARRLRRSSTTPGSWLPRDRWCDRSTRRPRPCRAAAAASPGSGPCDDRDQRVRIARSGDPRSGRSGRRQAGRTERSRPSPLLRSAEAATCRRRRRAPAGRRGPAASARCRRSRPSAARPRPATARRAATMMNGTSATSR